MTEKTPRDRKFEALFDGDEIEGKRYSLGDGVTGLDAPTAEYLMRAGRLAEVDDERFDELPSPAKRASEASVESSTETDEDRAKREAAEAEEAADKARLEAAHAAFDKGEIPTDLVNADAAADADDKLIAKDKLVEIAKAESAVIKSSFTKAELAHAIMAARAKAAESSTS